MRRPLESLKNGPMGMKKYQVWIDPMTRCITGAGIVFFFLGTTCTCETLRPAFLYPFPYSREGFLLVVGRGFGAWPAYGVGLFVQHVCWGLGLSGIPF